MITQEDVSRLSASEKVAAMEILWQALRPDSSDDAISPRHRRILDERADRLANGKTAFISWEHAKQKIDDSTTQ